MYDIETQAIRFKKYPIPLIVFLSLFSVFWGISCVYFIWQEAFLLFTILSGIFFAVALWATLMFLKLRTTTKPGLVIDQKGIHGRARYIGVGFIPWGDIADLVIHEEPTKRAYQAPIIYVAILVHNPDKYYKQTRLLLLRWYRRQSLEPYQTPCLMKFHYLEGDPRDLHRLLQKSWDIYRGKV